MTEAYDPTLLNALVAYPYATGPMLKRLAEFKDSVRFVLDSGAFTAWKAMKRPVSAWMRASETGGALASRPTNTPGSGD